MHLILNMHYWRSGQCLYKLSNTHTNTHTQPLFCVHKNTKTRRTFLMVHICYSHTAPRQGDHTHAQTHTCQAEPLQRLCHPDNQHRSSIIPSLSRFILSCQWLNKWLIRLQWEKWQWSSVRVMVVSLYGTAAHTCTITNRHQAQKCFA